MNYFNRLLAKQVRFSQLVKIDKSKKCYICKHKFPNGILNKFPKERKPLIAFFRGEFLFHMISTHGIDSTELVDMWRSS